MLFENRQLYFYFIFLCFPVVDECGCVRANVNSTATMNNEEIVQQTLNGDLETAKWAIPRVVKIFVSATRTGKVSDS